MTVKRLTSNRQYYQNCCRKNFDMKITVENWTSKLSSIVLNQLPTYAA